MRASRERHAQSHTVATRLPCVAAMAYATLLSLVATVELDFRDLCVTSTHVVPRTTHATVTEPAVRRLTDVNVRQGTTDPSASASTVERTPSAAPMEYAMPRKRRATAAWASEDRSATSLTAAQRAPVAVTASVSKLL